DVGGTHVSAARVDLAAATVDGSARFDFDGDELGTLVDAATSVRADRLGVAIPGPFDYTRGVSAIRHKLQSLYGVDLRGELANALEIAPGAVVFLNDADAFLLGEAWAGAARGHARALGVTLGTGLGSAFLAD